MSKYGDCSLKAECQLVVSEFESELKSNLERTRESLKTWVRFPPFAL